MIEQWQPARIFRLGLLTGSGRDAATIARDALVRSTTETVERRVRMWGGALRSRVACVIELDIPIAALLPFEAAGKRRGISAEAMIRQFVLIGAAEPIYIDNLVDDECN